MIKRIFFAVALLIQVLVIYGQKIDSLKALLPGSEGAKRCDILYELCYEYVDVDDGIAAIYGKQGYQLAHQLTDSIRIVNTGRIYASAIRRLGKLDSAILIYKPTIEIAEKKNLIDQLILIYNGIGLSHAGKADYDKGLAYHFKSLELRQQKDDTAQVTVSLVNIGFIYHKLKNYERALSYWLQAISLKKKIGYTDDLDLIHINIATSYAYLGKFEEAQKYLQDGLKFCAPNCSDRILCMADYGAGVIQFGLKNISEAETYFRRSHIFAKRSNDERFQLDNIDWLSRIYMRQGKYYEALEYLKQAESLILEGTSFNLEVIKIYSQFIDAHRALNNYNRLSFYQSKYIEAKDSIYNEDLTNNLMRIEAEYIERANKARIESQAQGLALKEQAINRQHITGILMGTLAITLVILAVILYKINRHKQKIHLILDQQVRERTKELERKTDELLKINQETDIILSRTSNDMKSSIATIKGLCSVGQHDITDPKGKDCLDKVSMASEQMSLALKQFHPH